MLFFCAELSELMFAKPAWQTLFKQKPDFSPGRLASVFHPARRSWMTLLTKVQE
jgi:hypothetical protein